MKSSKFVIHCYVLFLSLLLMAMPFYHQVTGREMQAALKINLDSVAGITGMLGLATFVGMTILSRRLSALEKAVAANNQPAMSEDGAGHENG